MYSDIRVAEFRCFRNFEIDGLRRINLLVGKNNTGKTTLLEAIFLLGGATNPAFPTRISQLRGQKRFGAPPDSMWRSLFRDLDPERPIEIEGQWNDEEGRRRLEITALPVSTYVDYSTPGSVGAGGVRSSGELSIGGLSLDYTSANGLAYKTETTFDPNTGKLNAPSKPRPDVVPSTYLSSRSYWDPIHDAEQFSHVVKAKREQGVIQALAMVEPALRRIEVVSEAGAPAVYADIGLSTLIPLAVCGEGMVRLFSTAVALIESRGGVLLVDEIDNGLHHSILQTHWNTLSRLVQEHDVQIFATTHSDELIESAVQAFRENLSTLGLFRLDRKDESHVVASYNEPALRAVDSEKFEVRG